MKLYTWFGEGAPVEQAFAPGPDEALGEEQEEDHGGDEGADGLEPEKGDREGQQEHGFHIKQQEQQTEQVVLRVEARLPVRKRIDPAFVEGVFFRALFDRGEKRHPDAGQRQRAERHGQRHGEENQNWQVGMVHGLGAG